MLSSLLIVCLLLSKNLILTPQFGFTTCFCVSTFYACFYVKKWNFDMHILTFMTILGGIFLFIVVSFAMQYILSHIKIKNFRKEHSKIEEDKVGILKGVDRWKLSIFICLQVIVLIWTYRSVLMLGKSGGAGNNLSEAINYYRYTSVFSDKNVGLPKILSYLREFCVSLEYIWSYLLIHSFVYKYSKGRILLGINIGLGICIDLILGARTGLFVLIVVGFVETYFIYKNKVGWGKKVRFSSIVKVIVLGVCIISSFQVLGNLLGRNSTRNFSEYIAIYLSAELKNLDIFIRNGKFGTDFSKGQTLIYVINYLSGRLGIASWSHDLDLPFQYINGSPLGNVYTTFYAFLYDDGFFGLIFFVIIMAIICQFSLRKAKTLAKPRDINIGIVIYSYIYFTIVFSFFSNKFYEMVFNTAFLRMLLYWYLVKWFIMKVKVDFINIKFKI